MNNAKARSRLLSCGDNTWMAFWSLEVWEKVGDVHSIALCPDIRYRICRSPDRTLHVRRPPKMSRIVILVISQQNRHQIRRRIYFKILADPPLQLNRRMNSKTTWRWGRLVESSELPVEPSPKLIRVTVGIYRVPEGVTNAVQVFLVHLAIKKPAV